VDGGRDGEESRAGTEGVAMNMRAKGRYEILEEW
jgi:hypothetical protein